MDIRTFDIPEVLAGQRLDRALSELWPDVSRARIQRWIDDGRVDVQGEPAGSRRLAVAAGQQLVVRPVFEAQVAPRPEPIALDVLHEDAECLVINKPAGLVVHPGAGNPDGTLQNALLHFDAALQAVPRAGLVHRLDKDTTGALLVARTPQAHHLLSQALERREIKRNYRALVWGQIIAGGTVDAPLGRHPGDRTRFHVARGGRPAVTHYRVGVRLSHHTWLRLALDTGRTHQIRVHMQHLRHPLVGDPVYGRRGQLAAGLDAGAQAAVTAFRRQALHARQLCFEHPGSGQLIDVRAPVPADLVDLLTALGASDEDIQQ